MLSWAALINQSKSPHGFALGDSISAGSSTPHRGRLSRIDSPRFAILHSLSPMATNTINLSLSPVPSLRLLSPYSPQNAPNLSFYSHFRPPIQLPSISHNTYKHTTATPRSLVIVTAVKTLSDTELVAVPLTAEEFNSKFPSETGVYAVYDKNDELQFVGISRNIAASVFSHLKSVPELCCSVKVCICLFYLFSLIIMISLQYLIERNNNFILILLKKKGE